MSLWQRFLRWACDHLDWHKPCPPWGFDGASLSGRCCRCGRRVLQDSQGNWFAVSEPKP
jgi:hypothetical protein